MIRFRLMMVVIGLVRRRAMEVGFWCMRASCRGFECRFTRLAGFVSGFEKAKSGTVDRLLKFREAGAEIVVDCEFLSTRRSVFVVVFSEISVPGWYAFLQLG